MTTTRVQQAREADVAEIERLVERSGPRAARLDWSTVISALGAFVAVADDRIAGVMVLWPHPDHVRIEAFTIDPAERGGGVGGALLDHAERLAAGTGGLRLLAEAVTPGVLAFAAGRGFVERDGVLEKRLA
ncbi:MAG: GNAT family N-acetyltransferase [Acidobacteria bacterium]|nr:GNAT family N-acetyltransferase [Acidobacteriota bacterium]